MKKIVAVLAAATMVPPACGDRGQPLDLLGPNASVQSELAGLQIIPLVARGYAFAHSSRDETGFAVKDGVQRTRQLRGLFAEAFGEPEHTYVMATSKGGAIALMLAGTRRDR